MNVVRCNWRKSVLNLGTLLVALSLPQALLAQWKATVGAQSKDLGRQALAFLPNEIWIHQHDSITWHWAVDEPHTVTFMTPGQVRLPFPLGGGGAPPFNTSPAVFDGTACVSTPPLMEPGTFTVQFTE